MKRINENTIELTQDEIDSLAQFIEESLDAAWAAAWDAVAWAAARVSQKDMLILMLNNRAAWQV